MNQNWSTTESDWSIDCPKYIIETEGTFRFVLLDNNDNIIIAITQNGHIIYGYGVPLQIRTYIKNSIKDFTTTEDVISMINDLKTELIEMIHSVGYYEQNFGYSKVLIGSNDEIIDSLRQIGIWEHYTKHTFFDDTEFTSLTIGNASQSVINNNAYSSVICDQNDTIVACVFNDGTVYISKLESPVIENVLQRLSVAEENINKRNTHPLYDSSDIGCLEYQDLEDTDYIQILTYGQSLSMGYECPEAISTIPINGNYMVGNSVLIGHGNTVPATLQPLVATVSDIGGEQPVVSCVNAFSVIARRFRNKNLKFIATSPGDGGKSIEQLSKECTNYSTVENNLYHTQFLVALDRTLDAVHNEGVSKTVGCSAIIFMQGEHNYRDIAGRGMTPGTDATQDKDTYKEYLMTLKNNMQSDIMSKYGQTKKPLFFIYQTCGYYIDIDSMPIDMAQYEFAFENDDVFLLNPTYFTPDYGGGHLSTNGYRWYGEMIAKSLSEVFIKGNNFSPIHPMDFVVNGKAINITMSVPVLPIVLDTWTKEAKTDFGFKVLKNGTQIIISSVEVAQSTVILKCSTELTGEIEIVYAGKGNQGSGNIRDSSKWMSLTKYYDDRETAPSKRENYTPKDKNGNYIYGKRYPMYNWCSCFYKKITV